MIIVSDAPTDPTWQTTHDRDREAVFLTWEVRADGEGGPSDQVVASLARALVAGGSIVFLGAAASDVSGEGWTRIGPEHWVARPPSTAALRWRGAGRALPLTWTSCAAVARTLFHQTGFDWTQQGQCVFLFGAIDPQGLDPASFLGVLSEDQRGPLPGRCLGVARPGTDGDFLELWVSDEDRKQAILSQLNH